MAPQVPLAWRNLTHDRRKLLVAMSGVAFAVMLMFQQRGFNNALFDSTVELIRELDGDVILFNPARFAISNEIRFPRRALDVAASTPGVAAADPLYLENVAARMRTSGRRARPIRVIAFNLDRPIFLDTQGMLGEQIPLLRAPDTALIDRLSKRNYGIDLSSNASWPQTGELANRHIEIVGLFQSGRDFAHDGNLLMSIDNFVNYFGYRAAKPLDVVDLGLLKVQPGYSSQGVADDLRQILGGEVMVLTKEQFVQKEISFWARNTPIGVIFMIGAVMGFAVGVIICYQILASDISDHMGEFATLKAMGYSNRYFFALVLRQAVYLAILGFLPGLFFSWLLFQFNSSWTGLLMHLTIFRVLTILLATVTMCAVSGMLALRKLLAADPASLF